MSFYYKETEPGLYTVGRDNSCGVWKPIKDYDTREEAEEQVHYLNGGKPTEEEDRRKELFFAHVMQGLLSFANQTGIKKYSPNPNHYESDQDIVDRAWNIVNLMMDKMELEP